ncbi:hypothetical protein D3C81_2016820 [compost metagenome]
MLRIECRRIGLLHMERKFKPHFHFGASVLISGHHLQQNIQHPQDWRQIHQTYLLDTGGYTVLHYLHHKYQQIVLVGKIMAQRARRQA